MINVKNVLKESFMIWNKIDEDIQRELINNSTVIEYKKGDIIHRGSATCIGLIVVESGLLRAFLASENGKQITVYKLHKNDICLFSASCVMKDIDFDINLECEEDTRIVLIPTEKYEKLLEKSTVISNYVGNILSLRFSDVIWILEQFVFHSLDKRLANYLLNQKLKDSSINITHEKIANELGSAREVISRMLKYFENENILTLGRNKITIIDIKKLENIAEK